MFLPTEVLDKMRVVIADANQVVRTWVRTQLSQAGVKYVTIAGNSTELLRQCSVTTPDVVLCDYHFESSAMSGQDLLDELAPKERNPFRDMLQRVQELGKAHCQLPSVQELTLTLRELVPRIARHGTFNFLLSNGQALWAHASTNLYFVVRQHPFSTARLSDEDVSVNFAEHTHASDRVAVVVTAPLTTDEVWTPFTPGELRVFVDGAPA